MDRELDQPLQRNLERLYNYLENPEREEAQRVLLAAEPEPIRITHGIPDLYTDWLSSPSYSAQGGLTGQLTQVISQTAGRPVLVFDDYFKVHEVTIRTVAETGGANSISVSDLQVQLNQQINTFIQDRIDGDKADKVSRLQSNISYLIEMG
ncbi:TPA: pesticin domain-containing protein, partial [Pseudomonas aeruginosa]|nr:pesticin domain-containing protein [Pseudomonas aeruginosa]HCW3504600.1 pesticin domain-containing protein [Pseudomonas aeruginosa]HCW3593923.1 pesticin domain-containing protein [Pseudomonas aeruginosa]